MAWYRSSDLPHARVASATILEVDSDRTLPPSKLRDLDNPNTRLDLLDVSPRVARSKLSEAYEIARARMNGVPSAEAGFRLFWVRGRDVGWLDLPRGGAHAVIGRHTNCDLVL